MVLFHQDSPSKLCMHLPCPLRATCPAHFLLLNSICRIIFGMQYRLAISKCTAVGSMPLHVSWCGSKQFECSTKFHLYFVAVCIACLTHKDSTSLTHGVYLLCTALKINSDYFPKQHNWLVFVMNMQCDFCDAETDILKLYLH